MAENTSTLPVEEESMSTDISSEPGKQQPSFQAPKKKNPWVRRGIALAVVAALGAGMVAVFLGQGNTAQAAGYLSAQAQPYDMTVTVTGPGTIKPNDSYRATALVRGEILSAPFEEGQTISKDDVLFTIDAGDVEDAVDQAIIAVEQAKDGVVRAQTGVEQAEASIRQADVGIRQADDSVQQAGVGIQQAEAGIQQAAAGVEQAQANITQANVGIRQAQSTVEQAQAGVQQAEAGVVQANVGVQQAEAGIQQAQAGVQQAEAGIQQAQATVEQAAAGVKQAQAGMEQAQATVQQAEAAVEQAAAGVEQAQANMTQAETGVIQADVGVRQAEAGIEQANDTVAKAEAGVVQAEAAVEQAQLAVQSAQLTYDSLTRDRADNKKDRQIKANATGVVTKIHVDPGDQISAGTPMAEILDRDQMKLTVLFHSAAAQAFSVGQPAVVVVSGTAEQLPGTISELAAVDTVGAGGTMVREVTIVVNNPGVLSPASTAAALVGGVSSSSSGNFAYNASEQLVALYSGKVESLTISEGSRVTDGQVVGMFEEASSFQDQIDAASISLGNAQAGLKTANAALDTAKLSLADAKIAQENAQLALESAQASKQSALASQDTAQAGLDSAQATLSSAEAGKSSAQASLNSAQAGLDSAQAGLDSAQATLSSAEAGKSSAQATLNNAQASLNSAEAGKSSAQASLNSAQASLNSAQASLDSAQASLDSAQAGKNSAIASQNNAVAARDNAVIGQNTARSSRETAQISRENAQISRESALTSLQDAQLGQQNAENSLKSARDKLDDYIITSPIDGVVIEKNYKVGDNFDPSLPSSDGKTYMAVIYDMSRLTFDIDVDELDAVKVRVGQPVVITADALNGQSFTGIVDKININGTTVNGKTTYPVTVLVDGDGLVLSEQGLWPGMNVSANIIVEKAGTVLAIPVDAVSRGNIVLVAGPGALNRDGVLVDPSKLEEREVVLGRNDEDYIEILSGLEEGETVYIKNSASNMMSAMMTMTGG